MVAMWPGAIGGVGGGWSGHALIRGEGRGRGSDRQRNSGAFLSALQCINILYISCASEVEDRSEEEKGNARRRHRPRCSTLKL